MKNNERVYKMAVNKVYPLYIQKVERKERTQDELDQVITWLTGYDRDALHKQLEDGVDFQTFFDEAPHINPNAHLITGVICGVRVENIEDPMMRNLRYLDKLVDELAKGRKMDKILRK